MNSSTNIHSLSYLLALMLLAVSIPLSKFMMSIAQFMLLGLWIWSGFSFSVSYRFFKLGGFTSGLAHLFRYIGELTYNNLIDKFALFFRNKPAVIFTLIYLMHIVGVFYTSDIDYALKDLRVKLPLLMLPVVISGMERINSRDFRSLMIVYTLAVFVSTVISTAIFLQGNYIDIREISPFISPIRLGLNVSFAFFVMLYFIFHENRFKLWQLFGFSFLALWFITFLFMLESVTSMVVIVIVGIVYLFMRIRNSMFRWQKIALLIIAVIVPLSFIWQVRNIVVDAMTGPEIDFEQLETHTPYGNRYYHDTIDLIVEDGKYVGLYICYKELKNEWNKRSSYDYNGSTPDGQLINTTLIRYLTSKDLRKDKDGVNSLTDEDIVMIENGLANYNYISKPGLRTRVLKIIKGYEVYRKTSNPSGSSVMQRIEYLRASLNIINENLLFGVGTGDLEDAFNAEFNDMNSALEKRYRYHAHNQFLGITVALGLIGFIVFMLGLLYPAIVLKGFEDYYFGTFFLIMIISMFSDDTLETQAGVTLFSFFYVFLLFGRKVGDNMPAKVNKEK